MALAARGSVGAHRPACSSEQTCQDFRCTWSLYSMWLYKNLTILVHRRWRRRWN